MILQYQVQDLQQLLLLEVVAEVLDNRVLELDLLEVQVVEVLIIILHPQVVVQVQPIKVMLVEIIHLEQQLLVAAVREN